MKLPVRNAEGKEVRKLEVDDSVFGIAPNTAVLHQAFVAQRANQRRGTAQTKSRGEVRGSTRKIRGQKYTGRARQGSIRAPQHVGGGVVFGPRLRDYSQALPKKMRRLAIRSALSGKLADGQLTVIDKLALKRPKTQEVLRTLRNMGIERSALIVTGRPDRTLLASVRNTQKTKVLPASYLNVVDMLTHHSLLMTEEAVRVAEGLWGRKAAVAVPAPQGAPKRRRAAKAEATARAPVQTEAPAAEAPTEEKPKRRPRAQGRLATAATPAAPRGRRAPAPLAGAPTEEELKRRLRTPIRPAAGATPAAPRSRRAAAPAAEAPAEEKPKRRVRPVEPRAPAEAPARPKGRRGATVAPPPSKENPRARARKAPRTAAAAPAAEPAKPRRRSKTPPREGED